VASGYTFQGRLLRPVLVRLRENGAHEASPASPGANVPSENQSEPGQPGGAEAAS
jgi:hypothetical protein